MQLLGFFYCYRFLKRGAKNEHTVFNRETGKQNDGKAAIDITKRPTSRPRLSLCKNREGGSIFNNRYFDLHGSQKSYTAGWIGRIMMDLNPLHLKDLQASGLSNETIRQNA